MAARSSSGLALGWGEFALLSSLTCDYLVHLGVEHARDSDKSTRSMAATGAMVWLLFFCQPTNWRAGWPLQVQRSRGWKDCCSLHGYQLDLDDHADPGDRTCDLGVRQSTTVLEEIDREDQENDLLRSRSDSPIRSRSSRGRTGR